MIFGVASFCAPLLSPATQAEPLTEQSCAVLATHEGEKPALRGVPGLAILTRAADDPLTVPGADGVTINAVVCWRSEARLAENDYLVAQAGFPLYVKTDLEDESTNRTLVLERVNGSFRARLLSGPALSDAERQEIQRLLSLYDTKYQDSPESSPAAAGTEVPPPSELSPKRPPDQPQPIADATAYEAKIAPYVAQARKTYPQAKRRFLQGLPRGYVFFVTTRLRDPKEHWEQAFIRVRRIQGDLITGVISTQLSIVDGYRMGQLYSFREAELLDWTIANPDGSEEGNVVGKFMDTQAR